MKKSKLHIIVLVLAATFLTSCNLSRYVPADKFLVKKNSIVIENNDSTDISKSSLSSYISLKPYKEPLQPKSRTWIYYKSEQHPKSRMWRWMNKTLGREPVYYDKSEAERSAKQLTLYLDKVGYFNSKVTHSVKTTMFKRAKITYHVSPAQPYRINRINYVINDSIMERFIMREKEQFTIHEGDIYDEFAMQEQRELITERLRNSGYYFFSRNSIYYEVDSNFMNHSLSITMHVKEDELAHKQYNLRRINVYPEFSLLRMNEPPTDSTILVAEIGRRKLKNTLHNYHYGKPKVKPSAYAQSIHLYEGAPYRLRNVTNTYKALNNFQIFNNVNIEFDTVPNAGDSLNLLDCRITMQQVDRHSYAIQAEGTRADADLGIKGSLSYTNRNIFRGAEVFQFGVKYGLEAQNHIDLSESSNKNTIFNTQEFGATMSLMFPRFLSVFQHTNFVRDYQPTTSIALGLNAQLRYYYYRYISSASFSYDWKNNYRLRHTFSPIYLNSVKIDNINPAFQEFLDAESNQRKKDQYTNHLIFGTRYAMTYSTQSIRKTGSFVYLRADFESSGNLLSLFNNTKLISESEGHHELFSIRYAQYLRGSFDIRQHIDLNNKKWLVFRQFIGLGVPYGNSVDMPFERSFYAGGANGLRGWGYRSVGPGGYVPTDDDIEKIGDMQLELNAEYRFPIRNIFNGALFVDAGNVWTYQPNEAMPNGEFKFDQFYKQLALDAGFGLRIDVSFLIIRLDLAYALRNSYIDENGSYWCIGAPNQSNLKLCWGIGYPF